MKAQFVWLVLGSLLKVHGLNECLGHCGLYGDDTTPTETSLRWCCESCNCRDLGDKADDSECALEEAGYASTCAIEMTQCEGHYGPGGDDATMSDPELSWCCNRCNCMDLSDRADDSECGFEEEEEDSGVLECPVDTAQIGRLNADIGGCGLEGCNARYQNNYPTILSCKEGCEERSDCKSFTWAPMNGDRNHPGVSACTLYNSARPNQVWGPQQIMCGVEEVRGGGSGRNGGFRRGCPRGFVPRGGRNADIPGCGMEGCGRRYEYGSVAACAAGCKSNSACAAFNYAPRGGDKNHVGNTVCTLYDQGSPTSYWGPNQIFCSRQGGARGGMDALFLDSYNGSVVDGTWFMPLMYLMAVLLFVNVICMTMSWWKGSGKKAKYRVVSVNSDTDV
eukprot:324661_1